MGLNAFIARDVIQYILPSIIALGLFLPLFEPNISAEYIVIGGALIGYFISSFIGWVGRWSILRLPYVRTRHRRIDGEFSWWNKNFDFGKLWISLTKDEKEYLYGTQSYYEFYLAICLYILLYGLINIVFTIKPISVCPSTFTHFWSCMWTEMLTVRTNVLFWKGGVPSGILALLSVILLIFNLRDMLKEYKIVFDKDGQYVNLARLYHRQTGDIATAIWGRAVTEDGSPVSQAQLVLSDPDRRWEVSGSTDCLGRWQFVGAFKKAKLVPSEERDLSLRISVGASQWEEIPLKIADKVVPEFEIPIKRDAVRYSSVNTERSIINCGSVSDCSRGPLEPNRIFLGPKTPL